MCGKKLTLGAELYVYECVCMYIQGVTGGTDQTSGGCSLC